MYDNRYDLHSHSTASDGSLTPTALVERAAAAGIGVLALTDHDETAGLAEAASAATAAGIGFVPGIELSVSWSHQTVHIVGLGITADSAPLQAGIERLREFRNWRAEEIGRRLEKAGIAGALAGARRYAGGTILSRTHFARFLVETGHARDPRQVFKRYLVRGKPGYVPGEWASLAEALDWIHAAGGLAVIAHPARYRFSATRLRQLLAEFVELGGVGLEVVSGSHSHDDVRHMAVLAQRFGLAASAGSDYHGPENAWLDLGRLSPLPEGCLPLWETDAWADLPHPHQASDAPGLSSSPVPRPSSLVS
jgi:predicted metal-dependent phosphoesterase TrpH